MRIVTHIVKEFLESSSSSSQPTFGLVLSHFTLVHSCTVCAWKIHCNIILLPASLAPKQSLPIFQPKFCMNFMFQYACYISHQSYFHWFSYPNNTIWRIQIGRLHIMHLPLFSCYFISWGDRTSFIHIRNNRSHFMYGSHWVF
jgi:hypothetical protein